MKTRWLDRIIAIPAPRMCLCLTADEYNEACKVLGLKLAPNKWVTGDACVHIFEVDGQTTTIVCIRVTESVTAVQIAALLVHEAVHIWQQYCADIGEKEPASEQEAYAIQSISQTLMEEYARRLEMKRLNAK